MSHHEHLTYCTLCFTTWAAARVVFCHFQMVIWRPCWIFVPVGLEALKILKMLELRANQCETDLHPCTGVSVNQPQRGDYTGSPPFWPVGEIDLSSSWPRCIIFAVKSVSWFVFSTLKLTEFSNILCRGHTRQHADMSAHSCMHICTEQPLSDPTCQQLFFCLFTTKYQQTTLSHSPIKVLVSSFESNALWFQSMLWAPFIPLFRRNEFAHKLRVNFTNHAELLVQLVKSNSTHRLASQHVSFGN